MDEEVEYVVWLFEDEFLHQLTEYAVNFVFLQVLLRLLVVLDLLLFVHCSYNINSQTYLYKPTI